MTVFQMLPEMVGPEEFLGLIALAELVNIVQMVDPFVPVGLGNVGEFLAAVTTDVDVRDLV